MDVETFDGFHLQLSNFKFESRRLSWELRERNKIVNLCQEQVESSFIQVKLIMDVERCIVWINDDY